MAAALAATSAGWLRLRIDSCLRVLDLVVVDCEFESPSGNVVHAGVVANVDVASARKSNVPLIIEIRGPGQVRIAIIPFERSVAFSAIASFRGGT